MKVDVITHIAPVAIVGVESVAVGYEIPQTHIGNKLVYEGLDTDQLPNFSAVFWRYSHQQRQRPQGV